MHELSITQSLLEIVIHEIEKHSISRVLAVKLKIGKFTNIEPSCLVLYFGALSKNTPVEGAELKIEMVPVRGRCRGCQKVFDLNSESLNLFFLCPACSGQDIEIINGRELSIEEIEGD